MHEVKWFAPDASEFAATPPLEALRAMISIAASDSLLHLDFLDVRKAHLNGLCERRAVTKLPVEVGGGYALLNRALYGTRDAASAWNTCVQTVLVGELGFERGLTSPCLFYHSTRKIRVIVHGDDFVSLAQPGDLAWLRAELRKRWLMKERGVLGKDVDSITILGRVLRRTPEGYELEGDPKHANLIVERLDLKPNSNGVTTPGMKLKEGADNQNLSGDAVTPFRSVTMRAAYLSLDRPDLCFAVKELARGMSSPTDQALAALRRLRRYLVKQPRVVQRFHWQSLPRTLLVEVDSDFAGCTRSRKSTSGFCALLGEHCLATKCRHQSVIATSSGEAEFYALVSGFSRAIGLKQLLDDLRVKVSITVASDSTAGLTMQGRQGLGRAKHISVQFIWAQEVLAAGQIRLQKVAGVKNRADLFTKHLTRATLERHLNHLGHRFEAALAQDAVTRKTKP